MASPIFCIQDRTGTVAQLTLEAPTADPIEVGDTGVYTGLDWKGTEQALDFTVGQVMDATDFGITTMTPTGGPGTVLQSGWPRHGLLAWLTGANVGHSPASDVIGMHPANAYITLDYFKQYHDSRGNSYPSSPDDAIQQAIVQGTDYLDQRYRYKGTKLLQFLSENPAFDPMISFLDPWLAIFAFSGAASSMTNYPTWFTPSYTSQRTEWPRQGCVDFNGDSVFGIPQAVQYATCEAAIRVLTGTKLQPDMDPNVASAGGVMQSISKTVGPVSKSVTYDTRWTGYMPDIPHVRRILSSAGLLVSAGGRTIIR